MKEANQNLQSRRRIRAAATQALAEFTTGRAQLLNQSRELVNC
jgi:hypothetical protein